jgi:uncharacterized protein (DUF433 family)
MSATTYAHSELRNGVPAIAGTRMKVVLLAMEHRVSDMDAAQLAAAHPHLTLGQIHSALAYYYDHKAALDREIARRERTADAIQAGVKSERRSTSLRSKLRSLSRRA